MFDEFSSFLSFIFKIYFTFIRSNFVFLFHTNVPETNQSHHPTLFFWPKQSQSETIELGRLTSQRDFVKVFLKKATQLLGVYFKIKVVTVESKKIKLQIWGTAGQERFRNITKTYFKVILVSFSSTRLLLMNFFRNIINWIRQVEQNAANNTSKILIGAKSELKTQKKVIHEDRQKLAKKHRTMFLELNGNNVHQYFHMLVRTIKGKMIGKLSREGSYWWVSIISSHHTQKKKCEC